MKNNPTTQIWIQLQVNKQKLLQNKLQMKTIIMNRKTKYLIQKVTRDNVFDYVIKGINDSDGDASLIRFQEPTYEANSDRWFIVATNKSGVGTTYKIYVDNTGHVTIYEGVNDNVVVNEDVSLN